jgi:hypothetical protein
VRRLWRWITDYWVEIVILLVFVGFTLVVWGTVEDAYGCSR